MSYITHNKSYTPTYITWKQMKQRCTNPKQPGWHRYGAIGITVCDRWNTFINFFHDMGERPDGLSLDRIDNTKGYFPGNCRWTDARTQSNNMVSNVHVTYNGKTRTLAEWARHLGMKKTTLQTRISTRKWSIKRAIETPVNYK